MKLRIFTSLTALIALTILMMQCNSKPETVAESQPHDSVAVIAEDFIFGDDRPFPQCHASTVLPVAGGSFLVAWFGGTHEKHDDVGIWLSKGTPGKWSAPREVAKLREDPHWNPVLFRKDSNEVILYFKVGKTIDEWETWYMTSRDDGETWSEAKELVAGDKGGRGPVRNKPLLLSNGALLAPASNEKKGVWNAFVDRSEDGGTTWTASAFVPLNRDSFPGEGVIQPALWESQPGHVHMLLRSSAGVICRSDSEDYGKTWSLVYKTSLPNPNSGIDLTKLANGTLVLIFNRDSSNWGARHPISLAVSKDNGKTWPVITDLEKGSGDDEFSYPSVVSLGDTVALTYTWKRQRIAFRMAKID